MKRIGTFNMNIVTAIKMKPDLLIILFWIDFVIVMALFLFFLFAMPIGTNTIISMILVTLTALAIVAYNHERKLKRLLK